MDYLVQRYLPNLPNETTGGWVDEAIIRDLSADEAEHAATVAARAAGQSDPSLLTARRRAIRWEHVAEFNTAPDGVVASKATKVAP